MFDKLKQLQQMKEQMDAVKNRLDNISVRGECEGVTVVANGNRKIKEVILPANASSLSLDDLSELMLMATNRALENAESVFESEMRSVAGGMMGGLGLF
jgi:hypothetical protein